MCGSVQHMCLQCYVNTYKNVYIIYTLYMDYTELTPMPVSIANIKQHRWRERQLDIFYRTGRPIFNMNINNKNDIDTIRETDINQLLRIREDNTIVNDVNDNDDINKYSTDETDISQLLLGLKK